jgi:peptidoglycan/xylan/chitin deacetylase (PgdA/CDA1 family)
MPGHGPGRARSFGTIAILVAAASAALVAGACVAALTTVHGSPAVAAASSAGQPTGLSSSPVGGPAVQPAGSSPAGSEPTSLPAIPAGAVPILYYHRVEAIPVAWPTWTKTKQAAFIEYDVIPTAFAAQLDWLAANGYTTILPRDLAAHWDNGQTLPAKPVILTFDDGWHDWVTTVLPMLQARGMQAEFYLTLAAIAAGNISWPEVQALASAGEGIGAHDVHHVQLAELGKGHPDASPATMWAELNGARQTIGSHIGVYPDSMAYVGGGFSPTLEALAEQAGYTTARTIRRGIVQTAALRFELHVVRIGPYDDVTNRLTWTIDPNLPTFIARMHGVSDLAPGS